MKRKVIVLILFMFSFLLMGSDGKSYGSTDSSKEEVATENAVKSEALLYYYIDSDEITVGLPKDWNAVQFGMPETSPVIKALGYKDKKALESYLTSYNCLLDGRSEDLSMYYTVQMFPVDEFFQFNLDNLAGASEQDVADCKKNVGSVGQIDTDDWELVTVNGITYLDDPMNDPKKESIALCFTVIDKRLYFLEVGYSGSTNLNTEQVEKIKAFKTDFVSNTYFGSKYKAWAEDCKPAISEKEAKLAEQQAATPDSSSNDKLLGGTRLFWLFPILLAVIILAGMKLAKRKEWQEEPLSLTTSKGLQGFCAAAIILHHMSQNLFYTGKDPGAIVGFVNIGVFMVGVFFFFSGYGLLKSFTTKENYLKGFLRKRLPTILVPFYVCNMIFILVTLAHGAKFSTKEWIVYLTGYNLINATMWYIVEIFFFYLAFFIIFKLVKKKSVAIAHLGVFTIAMIALGVYRTNGTYGEWFQGEWWFNSTLLLFVGVLFCQFETKLIALAKKLYWLVLPGMAACTAILYIKTMSMLKNYHYGTSIVINLQLLVWQVLMIMAFVLTLVLISLKVKFSNPMLTFLGKISLELYLIHNVFITYLRGTMVQVNSDFVYIALVILYAILFASLLHPFDQKLISLISGRRKAGKVIKAEESINAVIKERNHFVDCWRLVAAFLVVCVHIPFQGSVGPVVIIFAKTAVPFFLVISGYLCYSEDNTAFLARLKKQATKIYYLYLCANIFYVVLMFFLNPDALISGFTGKNLVNFLLYNESPFAGHLWYLGSMLYALLLIMLLTKLKLHKYAMYLAPVCIGAYFILSRIGNREYYVYRNFLFVTFGYMMMGCLIRRYQDILQKVCRNTLLFHALGVLYVTNVMEWFIYQKVDIPFFSAEIMVYVIILIMLKYPYVGKGTIFEWLGSKCSLSIYIIHIAIIQILKAMGIFTNSVASILAPFIVFVISLVIAFHYQMLKEKRGRIAL